MCRQRDETFIISAPGGSATEANRATSLHGKYRHWRRSRQTLDHAFRLTVNFSHLWFPLVLCASLLHALAFCSFSLFIGNTFPSNLCLKPIKSSQWSPFLASLEVSLINKNRGSCLESPARRSSSWTALIMRSCPSPGGWLFVLSCSLWKTVNSMKATIYQRYPNRTRSRPGFLRLSVLWTLGLDNSLLGGFLLIAECLAAFLASIHPWDASTTPPSNWQPKMSPDFTRCIWEEFPIPVLGTTLLDSYYLLK